MLVKRRRPRAFWEKILVLFIVLLLTFSLFFIFYFFFLRNTSIVSPIAKSSTVKSVDLEKNFKKLNIPFESVIVATDSSYIVFLSRDRQINISSQKEISNQVSSLQRILRELTIEGKDFKNIDFRFERPIITYE